MAAKKKILFFLLAWLTGYSYIANAQQGNIWYFGINAGLDFNVTPPRTLTNGAMTTFEGCATICNKKGQLLFYTDGIKVYDRLHTVMPNGSGLLGNSSSTQSAIIVPNPGDSNIYYIFTADCAENSFVNGYNYSVVDMRLNNNLGNITAQKNIPLYKPCTERLTAVKAANGIDYWVITKGLNNNSFLAYKIDCSGINVTPVISNTGRVHTYDPDKYVGTGQMKVSPDGRKLSLPILWPVTLVQLFDFDNNTGIVSNAIDLPDFNPGIGHIYGVEFSPNSKLLYVSTVFDNSIHQYDITSGNATAINASRYVIGTSRFFPNALQLSPDKRIFIAFSQSSAVSVINNPNVYGAGCNFSLGSIDLAERLCWIGLPAYISSFFDESKHVDFISTYADCHTNLDGSTDLIGNLKWKWDFGDGTIDSGQHIRHVFKQPGSYDVTLKLFTSAATCGPDITDSFTTIKTVVIGADIFAVDYSFTETCVNQPVQFSDSTILTSGNIISRIWDFGDGSTKSTLLNPVHTYSNTGIYNVKLLVTTSGICKSDSMIKQVFVGTRPVTSFSAVNGCMNQPLQFTDNSTGSSTPVSGWKWAFGDGGTANVKNPLHLYKNYGNYNVQLQVSSYGCLSNVIITQPVIIDSKPEVIADYRFPCLDQPTVFSSTASNVFGNIISTIWLFGDNTNSTLNNPIHQYLDTGRFNASYKVVTENGCVTTLIKNIRVVKAVANAGPDSITIINQPIQLNGSGGGIYSWTPAANLNNAAIPNPVAILQNNTNFTLLTTSTEGCTATDKVFIKIVPAFDILVPNAFTPNGDGVNDKLKPSGIGIDHLNYFKIFNRAGEQVFFGKTFNDGWNGKFHDALQPQGSFVWIVQGVDIYRNLINRKGSSVLLH